MTSRDRAMPAEVADTFASYPDIVRSGLFELRLLIFDAADETDGVGRIDETLKWGQPSYLTTDTGSGTTIRLAPTPANSSHDYGLFVHCATDLVSQFRDLFGHALDYDTNRGVLLRTSEPTPTEALRECIALAFTYHQRR